MSFSTPFIRRPVGTTLLTIGLFLAGALAYPVLPVSSLPQVDFPTISVQASLPGASPETMATSVATPLERQFGRIAGVTEMTSTSVLGSSSIVLQFDLNRNIDGAARDVQAAINAARGCLPAALPTNPSYRKVNPADAPIIIIALTSPTKSRGQMYDIASSILQQKLAQVRGVGQVIVGGSSLPSVRVELNPSALNKYGIALEDVRQVLAATNVNRPKGSLSDATRTSQILANDQMRHAADYVPVIVAYRHGQAVRLEDVARVEDSVEDVRTIGLSDGKPAVAAGRLPPARRQHHPDGRPHLRAAAGAPGHDPRGDRPQGGPRPDDDDSRLALRRGAHPADLDRARDPGGLRVPPERAPRSCRRSPCRSRWSAPSA